MSTTTIRQKYNELLNNRYHWQEGISKFWNRNFNDAVKYVNSFYTFDSGGDYLNLKGNFDKESDMNIWNQLRTSKSWSNLSMYVTATANGTAYVTTPLTAEEGVLYNISFNYKNISSGMNLIINNSYSLSDALLVENISWDGLYSFNFTGANGSLGTLNHNVYFEVTSGSATIIDLDDIIIKKVVTNATSAERTNPIQYFDIHPYYSTSGLRIALPCDDCSCTSDSACRTVGGEVSIPPNNTLTGSFRFINNEYIEFNGNSWTKWFNSTVSTSGDVPYFDSTESCTVMFWTRPHADTSSSHYNTTLYNGSKGDYFASRWNSVTVHRFVIVSNGEAQTFISPVSTTGWSHNAMVYGATENKHYVNGVLVGSSGNVEQHRTPGDVGVLRRFYFGSHGTGTLPSGFTKADIMGYLQYNRELTQQEIKDAANCRRPYGQPYII